MTILRAAVLASILASLVLGSPAPARAGSEAKALTNAAVVEMTKAHLSAAVIVEQIKSRPGNFALEPADLIKLKKQGVAEEVILAMQKKGQGGENEPAKTAKAGRHAAAKPQFRVKLAIEPEGVWRAGSLSGFGVVRGSGMGLGVHTVKRVRLGAEKGIVQVSAGCDYSRPLMAELTYALELPVGEPRDLDFPYAGGVSCLMGSGRTSLVKIGSLQTGTTWLGDVYQEQQGCEAWSASGPSFVTPWSVGGREVRKDHVYGQYSNHAKQTVPALDLLTPAVFQAELPLYGGGKVQVEVRTGDPLLHQLVGNCELVKAYNAYLGSKAVAEDPRLAPTLLDTEPERRAADAFVFGSLWNWRPRAEFGTELKDGKELKNRVATLMTWHGVSPADYEKELEVIPGLVAPCVKLDGMAKKAKMQKLEDGTEVEDVAALGEEFAVCQQPVKRLDLTEMVGGSAKRHLWLEMKPRGSKKQWRETHLVGVYVGFSPLEGDTGVEPGEKTFLEAYLVAGMSVWGPNRPDPTKPPEW